MATPATLARFTNALHTPDDPPRKECADGGWFVSPCPPALAFGASGGWTGHATPAPVVEGQGAWSTASIPVMR